MKNKRDLFVILGGVVLVIIISIGVFSFGKVKENKEKERINEELSFLFENEAIKPEDDVYSLQAESDKKIKEAMDNKKYTLDDPFVLENPYYISPLSAIVVFQSNKSVEATLEVNGKTYTFEATKKHAIPVYGLVAGKVNEITIKCDGKTKKINIDVTDVEDDLKLDIATGKGVDLGSDIYVVTSPGDEGLFGFNTNGELIWRITETFSLAITELDNGHLLLADSNYISISFSRKGLVEIDYLGKIYNVYDIDGGYHHASIVMENGNYILGSTKINSATVNDYIIEINPKTGKVGKEWDLTQIFNNVSNGFVESLNNPSWAFNNSIFYDKATNSLILSLRGRNSIVSIGYDSKDINWIFGDSKYWNSDFNKYFVVLENDEYPRGSHSAAIDTNGNLVLFNNNMDASSEEDSPCEPYINVKSSADIYKIEGNKATVVSKFTDDDSFFSYAVSNYYQETNGNYVALSAWQFAPGSMTASNECTLNQISNDLTSTLYELDKDQNILFKATIPYGTYRANKVALYNNKNANFEPAEINYYNTLDQNIYDTVNTGDILEKLKNAEKQDFSIDLTENLLSVNAAFQTNDEVFALLVGNDGNTYKYLVKSEGYYLQPVINLRGIEGTYALFLVINNEYYNLDTVYSF